MKEILMENKGIVLLGLHHSDAKELFPNHVIKAGYKPVTCPNVDTIIDLLGRTEIRACMMDLNFEKEEHKRLNNPVPAQRVVKVLREKGYALPSTFMGFSSNNELVGAAHELLIPGYKYLVDFITERHRVIAFLKREEHFTPERFPTEPEAFKQYLHKISGLPL